MAHLSNALILELIDVPFHFRPIMVRLTGSAAAGVMLSMAIDAQQQMDRGEYDPSVDRWWSKTPDEWEKETGLSPAEQETARSILRNHTFWHEKIAGDPACTWYRVDLKALADELRVFDERGRKQGHGR